MCCSPIPAAPTETVGKCPACGCDIDEYGDSTEEGCSYSPEVCGLCHDCPCDGSC